MFATAYLLYASVCGSLVLIDRFSQDCLVIAFYILFHSWANFMKIHRRVKKKKKKTRSGIFSNFTSRIFAHAEIQNNFW